MIFLAALRTELLFVPRPRACVGVGAEGWPQVSARLRSQRPSAAAVLGFSGSLRGELAPGTLVLATSVRGNEAYRPSAELVTRAQTALPQALAGSVLTVAEPATPEQKARMGIDDVAVDMESERLARGLEELNIPWLTVRVILDALWETLPSGVHRLGWTPRALMCARTLGRAARQLTLQVAEAER